MDLVLHSHIAYLTISVAATVWVARTLYRNGKVFLVDAFGGQAELASSVNHLLVVGFYLINVGFVAVAIRYGDRPSSVSQLVEAIATRVGAVLLVLGVMHFINIAIFSRIRSRGWQRVPDAPR